MDWKQAFLAQAASDLRVYDLFEEAADVEDCHRVHYLQMMTEKLAKSYFAGRDGAGEPPEPTHASLVRLLQTMKGMPPVRRRLGIQDTAAFNAYVRSLLPLALSIQSLAPAIAGTARPNPEYPWTSAAAGDVIAPCRYRFEEFRPRGPAMVKLIKLVRALVQLGNEVQ